MVVFSKLIFTCLEKYPSWRIITFFWKRSNIFLDWSSGNWQLREQRNSWGKNLFLEELLHFPWTLSEIFSDCAPWKLSPMCSEEYVWRNFLEFSFFCPVYRTLFNINWNKVSLVFSKLRSICPDECLWHFLPENKMHFSRPCSSKPNRIWEFQKNTCDWSFPRLLQAPVLLKETYTERDYLGSGYFQTKYFSRLDENLALSQAGNVYNK